MRSVASSARGASRLCATPPKRSNNKAPGRPWVLDTGTKGTGAEMVPLEKVLKKPGPGKEPVVLPPTRRPPPAAASESRKPRRFKVVDVMSGQVLAQDVDARAAVEALEGVRSIVDVRVYVWQPRAKRWRLLNLGEQKAMWEQRRSTSP